MVRRSVPQRKVDDGAFPVRVRVIVPEGGFGNRLNDMIYWLQDKFPPGCWAHHGGGTRPVHTMAVYFRTVADAERFIARFPEVELADFVRHGR